MNDWVGETNYLNKLKKITLEIKSRLFRHGWLFFREDAVFLPLMLFESSLRREPIAASTANFLPGAAISMTLKVVLPAERTVTIFAGEHFSVKM